MPNGLKAAVNSAQTDYEATVARARREYMDEDTSEFAERLWLHYGLRGVNETWLYESAERFTYTEPPEDA
jgi:hypothetical protein